ncbi:hypothetical protein HYS97_02680 [Candidatus Daviesbacteria bacterium]|nr:hypothetical protein [Candidatus Daviesbacteria bacterium]
MELRLELGGRPILDNSQVESRAVSAGNPPKQIIDAAYGRTPDINTLLNRAPTRHRQIYKGKPPQAPEQ